MLENVTCQKLCTTTVSPGNVTFLSDRIQEGYSQNWVIDGLPGAEMKIDSETGDIFYQPGFALGSIQRPTAHGNGEGAEEAERRGASLINNHFDIFIDYHSRDGINQRVVGVVVWPSR